MIPGEYILKDDLVDNLNIKDEIAKDLGLKDEITSALDQHEESKSNQNDFSDSSDLLGRLGDQTAEFSGSFSDDSDSLIRKLSDDDAAIVGDEPSVCFEEALQLVLNQVFYFRYGILLFEACY